MTSRLVCVIVLGLTLWACKATSGAESPSPAQSQPANASDSVFFARDVMPVISRLGCNSVQCHGSFAGKGGMAFSLFGGSPEDDYETLVKAERAKRVNRMEPAKSPVLLKATGAIKHEGAQQIAADSPEYKTILAWIEQGARYDDPALPKLAGVSFGAAEAVLAKGAARALSVAAEYSDGSQEDVTRLATFRSSDPRVAAVDAAGQVTAVGFGMCAIVGQYSRHGGAVQVIVPQPLDEPFPAFEPFNKIDELVAANLKKLGLPPSELCSDEVFLRRVYLDTTGLLPKPDDARAFLTDQSPTKRKELIDRLLGSDEFTAFAALKWGDILCINAEDPMMLWPKGAEAYYQWVYAALAENKPFDQFARELLTASGSNFRSGASNFFRAVSSREPQTYGESAALVFMGARLACARCHGHPEESWAMDDNLGMGAFFGQVKFKFTSEWKEEILYRDPAQVLRHPRTGRAIAPQPLGGAPMELKPGADSRVEFARWLTAPENPWFARNIVNRIWFWLLGRGIVHEPDDMRPTNLPENPALLDYLAKDLVDHRYDLRHVYRLILNSRTYQLSSVPRAHSENGGNHFAHYNSRRLTAEQMIDALAQVIEVKRSDFGAFERPTLAPITTIPDDTRAAEISDGSAQCMTAAIFGRPTRATGFESERSTDISLDHVAFIATSPQVTNALNASPRIQRLVKAKASEAEIVDELFLAALSRLPQPAEKAKMVDYLTQKKSSLAAVQDVMWAVLNSDGFVVNE